MGLSLVTGPTTEPLTLAEAKAHCNVAIPDDDGLIAGYILAARHWIEGQTHRLMLQQTWDYTIDYCWPTKCYRQWIEIPLGPLVSVSYVNYLDEAGAYQALATDQYVVLTDRSRGVITTSYNVTWPSVQYQPQAISIRFVAGYSQTPDELRMAMQLLVGHWVEHRGDDPEDIPPGVEALISPFRSASVC